MVILAFTIYLSFTIATAITSYKNTEDKHVPFYSSTLVPRIVAFSFLFMFVLLLAVNIALVSSIRAKNEILLGQMTHQFKHE